MSCTVHVFLTPLHHARTVMYSLVHVQQTLLMKVHDEVFGVRTNPEAEVGLRRRVLPRGLQGEGGGVQSVDNPMHTRSGSASDGKIGSDGGTGVSGEPPSGARTLEMVGAGISDDQKEHVV